MFEYVPTAPDSLPTAIADRARCSRARSRSAARHHSASLAPNVVGSACTPWVRPTIGVSRNSSARAFSTDTSDDEAASSTSAARTNVADNAVSTTSEDVSP